MSENPDLPALVKASQVAALLGVHVDTLARWSAQGILPAPVRVGPGRRRFYRSEDIAVLVQDGAPK